MSDQIYDFGEVRLEPDLYKITGTLTYDIDEETTSPVSDTLTIGYTLYSGDSSITKEYTTEVVEGKLNYYVPKEDSDNYSTLYDLYIKKGRQEIAGKYTVSLGDNDTIDLGNIKLVNYTPPGTTITPTTEAVELPTYRLEGTIKYYDGKPFTGVVQVNDGVYSVDRNVDGGQINCEWKEYTPKEQIAITCLGERIEIDLEEWSEHNSQTFETIYIN